MSQGNRLQSEKTERAIQQVDRLLLECDRRKIDPIAALQMVCRKWDERNHDADMHPARDAKNV